MDDLIAHLLQRGQMQFDHKPQIFVLLVGAIGAEFREISIDREVQPATFARGHGL